jgi:hypothetical protein
VRRDGHQHLLHAGCSASTRVAVKGIGSMCVCNYEWVVLDVRSDVYWRPHTLLADTWNARAAVLRLCACGRMRLRCARPLPYPDARLYTSQFCCTPVCCPAHLRPCPRGTCRRAAPRGPAPRCSRCRPRRRRTAPALPACSAP